MTETKDYLKQHFMTKDLGNQGTLLELKLHIKIKDSLSQRKYEFDLLQGIGLLKCKHVSIPIEAYVDF